MNERFANVLKNRWTIPVVVGVTSFAGGIGVGYILANRQPKTEPHALPAQLTFDYDRRNHQDYHNR